MFAPRGFVFRYHCMMPRLFFFVAISLCGFFSLHAQELSTRNKRAIELYQESDNFMIRRQYRQVVNLLNQAINRDFGFTEAHMRLALAHKALDERDKALKFFEEVIKQKPNSPAFAKAYSGKADLLFFEMKYEEAISFAEQYLQLAPRGDEVEGMRRLIENARFSIAGIQNPVEFKPRALSAVVNSFQMQYFPSLTADEQILFFTARNGNSRNDDEDIFISKKLASGDWGPPQPVSRRINTQYNEGTCSISADGRMMIFTACEGRKGFGSCDLYYTYKSGDQWAIPENLGPNINTAYWESQPSLSADGNVLFFVSNRPGGLGGRDIYVSRRDEQGNWLPARNLGPPVNTTADEVSPFIHANGLTLFFASTGHPGFGGFDLFFVERNEEEWSAPKNLGFPINNAEDQVSLFITASGTTAYYSNERRQGNVYVESKLYSFELPPEIQVRRGANYVKGRVVDALTGKPMAAVVELYDLLSNELTAKVKADSASGEYLITLTKGSEYALYVSQSGYLFDSRYFSSQEGESLNYEMADILLNRIERGKSVNLNNLFFDFDKFDLRDKSKTELQKIIAFMQAYPDIKIEVEGHTDNIGDARYNQNLSENRAKSVYNYLVQAGISSERIQSKGYGASRPIADNATEEGRQQNRRIAFKIL
jgi:outer membrane protein OmpA-like peptidoglycan-associated protein/tetratricopeptide (TPR) repeat protein